ncbi:MAG: energy transducer TonB [Hyphomicrobiales bacterium]|nr:energy transducer TonB [Hyphomicrobiales bacterium]
MTAEQACAPPVEGIHFDLRDLQNLHAHRTARLRLMAIFLLSLSLHAAGLLLPETRSAPDVAIEEAIPVEIIVEQPAPPAPQPEEPVQAEQAQQVLDEKPVSDFVRSTEQDRESGKDALPPPEQQSSEIQPAPERLEPLANSEPILAQALPPKMQQYALMAPLPDFDFKAPAKRTQDTRGSADPGYLSTLYGRIMKEMRVPKTPPSSRRIHGRVVFGVLSSGRIIQEAIAIRSGVPELDAMALAAVRKGEPYARPPNGGPVYIVFDYGAR